MYPMPALLTTLQPFISACADTAALSRFHGGRRRMYGDRHAHAVKLAKAMLHDKLNLSCNMAFAILTASFTSKSKVLSWVPQLHHHTATFTLHVALMSPGPHNSARTGPAFTSGSLIGWIFHLGTGRVIVDCIFADAHQHVAAQHPSA
jgi:hypothetical protein